MRFNRVANLIAKISDNQNPRKIVTIEGLRIAFNVVKTLSYSANTASIQIYNLSQTNRNLLKNIGDEIILNAGYANEDGPELLFVGNITKVSHTFRQPDIITSIECADGERPFVSRIISVSYQEKTPIRSIIQDICGKVGIEISFFASGPDLVYSGGFSDVDTVRNLIIKLCNSLNLFPSFQNEKLYITENEQGFGPLLNVNINNAMISSPERWIWKYRNLLTNTPQQGWKIQTLLRPEIIPGNRINVKSIISSVSGNFKVESATHVGDTYGDPWDSTFEVYQI